MKFPIALLSLLFFVNSAFAAPWTEQQRSLAKAFSDSCYGIDLRVSVTNGNVNSKVHVRVADPLMHKSEGSQIKEWTKGLTRDQMEALLRTGDFTAEYITTLMTYIDGLPGEFPAKLSVRLIKPSANEPIVVQMHVVSHDAGSGLAIDASEFIAKCVK